MIKPLMSFLEASKLSKDVESLTKTDLCIKTSASLYQLEVYLKAFAARNGFNLNLSTIEFGTLQQSLHQNNGETKDIFILFPWDFLGSLDWRTGVKSKSISVGDAIKEIDNFFDLMTAKAN